MKFYHYPHCPFCQRVRLALKFKNLEYEDIPLSYADVETPTKLIGAKMLPIIDFGDGTVMAESLDLLAELERRFPEPGLYFETTQADLDWSSQAVFSITRYFDLVLPWYLEAYKNFPEFDEAGADYFQSGKEKKRGITFNKLRSERFEIFSGYTLPSLREITLKINDGFIGAYFSAADCVLAADLFGVTLVPDIEVPKAIIDYIAAVEGVCGENLLD